MKFCFGDVRQAPESCFDVPAGHETKVCWGEIITLLILRKAFFIHWIYLLEKTNNYSSIKI